MRLHAELFVCYIYHMFHSTSLSSIERLNLFGGLVFSTRLLRRTGKCLSISPAINPADSMGDARCYVTCSNNNGILVDTRRSVIQASRRRPNNVATSHTRS